MYYYSNEISLEPIHMLVVHYSGTNSFDWEPTHGRPLKILLVRLKRVFLKQKTAYWFFKNAFVPRDILVLAMIIHGTLQSF